MGESLFAIEVPGEVAPGGRLIEVHRSGKRAQEETTRLLGRHQLYSRCASAGTKSSRLRGATTA